MTVTSRLALAAITLILPLTSAAVEPAGVTGISAIQTADGDVVVSWEPVAGSVAGYRIFISDVSILETGGMYDDYEDVSGNISTHTLQSVPPVRTLYVSVLARSAQGEESPYFMEEAFVKLSNLPSASDAAAFETRSSISASVPASESFQLLSATARSSTGVTLLFTHPVVIPPSLAEPFTLAAASGTGLRVHRYRVDGATVMIDTDPQMARRVYEVRVHATVQGRTADGRMVAPDDALMPLLFTGYVADDAAPSSDVRVLTLVASGTTVEARWLAPSGIRELQVQQSIDGGATFGAVSRMDPTSRGVVIPGVTPGTFTLLVRVVAADGTVSSGVRQSVRVGRESTSAKPVSPSASSPSSSHVTPDVLPSSGLEIATILTLSGAVTGMRFVRRKNAANRKE